MCHGLVGIGTIFRVAWGRYWPSSVISWTLKWYWIQLHLILFHSLKTMLFYCFIVREGSLTVNMQSSPYWSNSKQLDPGRMVLPQWSCRCFQRVWKGKFHSAAIAPLEQSIPQHIREPYHICVYTISFCRSTWSIYLYSLGLVPRIAPMPVK